ncbi:MAG TPA: hypothetical protein VGJ84_02055 [Polyangiaceae bacterium]|jgi:hypothetical protein
MNKALASAFAISAATAFLAGCSKEGANKGAGSPEAAAKIKCMGANACKGQSACDTTTHSCAGQNDCKGKGWVLLTREECETKGGQSL